MATVHLISGLPGSGKTTHSKELASRTDAVHFSLDTWLITAFGSYEIETIGHDEHVRRVHACRKLIWNLAPEFLQRDVDIILDDGFFLRKDRKKVIEMADKKNAKAKIHYLKTPLSILRERLQKRNNRLPKYHFWIDPEILEMFVDMYEVPHEDEGAEIVVVDE